MNEIFRLTVVFIDERRDCGYGCFLGGTYLFRTLRQAEKKTTELKDEWSENTLDEIYGFYIQEYPLCKEIDWRLCQECESWRIYDHEGRLIEQSLSSGVMLSPYTYPPYICRSEPKFRPGDIVEVFDGKDTITPGIVCQTPPATGSDTWNDEYRIALLTSPDMSTLIHSMFVFPPRSDVPDHIKKRLRDNLRTR